jgi:hypothetical protein
VGSSHGYRRAPVKTAKKKTAKKDDGVEEQVALAPSTAFQAHDAERGASQLDPHAALRLQRSAGNAALTTVIQRKKGKRTMAPNVGAVDLGFDVGGIAPGKGGYSSRMMVEAGEMAEQIRADGGLDAMLLKQVAPDVSGVAAQERVMGRVKPLWEEQKSGWAGSSTNAIYQARADGAQRWLNKVAEDQRTLQIEATSFNAFVPRGNSFFVSAARLSSMQSLLGATDNQSLVTAIVAGLADAKAVAQKYRDAVEGGDARSGPETLNVPEQDNTVEEQAGEVTLSVKELNNAYLGFRIAMTGQEIDKVEAEGAADREKLAKIEAVKQAFKQVGGMIDTTMSVVSGAPAAVANITNTMRKTEAQVNAYRNKRAIMKGGKPGHNPTYVTTDEQGNMMVANAQTGMQRPIEGGDSTEIPKSGFALPTSVENIMGNITEFIYAKEVREIQIRLQGIANRVTAITEWKKGAEINAAILRFQTALAEFAKRCQDLQQRIAARRNAYLDFGVQLDRFARANKELARDGLGTGKGQERYTTIMTVAGQIRETLALGRNATGGLKDPREFAAWAQEARDHRQSSSAYSHRNEPFASPPFWNVPSYDLTPGEIKAIESIFAQSTRYEGTIGQVTELFGPVDAAAGELFSDQRVSPGGGTGAY